MELRNPTDQPNAVNNRAALNAKNDPFKMYGPDGFKPSSTAADRLAADPSLGVPNPTLNKFLSSRAVELATDYDARQATLAGVGAIPLAGIPADVLATADSAVNLDLLGAGLGLLALSEIPGLSQSAAAAKIARAGGKIKAAAGDATKGVADKIATAMEKSGGIENIRKRITPT